MFKIVVNFYEAVIFLLKMISRTISGNGRDHGTTSSHANRRNSADQTFGTWEKWLVLLTWIKTVAFRKILYAYLLAMRTISSLLSPKTATFSRGEAVERGGTKNLLCPNSQ